MEVPSSPCPHPVPSALMAIHLGKAWHQAVWGRGQKLLLDNCPPAKKALELQAVQVADSLVILKCSLLFAF